LYRYDLSFAGEHAPRQLNSLQCVDALEANGVAFAFGYSTMLCLMVHRDMNESPEVGRLSHLLDLAYRTSELLK
jgi:hypothetical protein